MFKRIKKILGCKDSSPAPVALASEETQKTLETINESINKLKESLSLHQQQMEFQIMQEISQTKEAVSKLGRTQYRANAVAEAEQQEIKKNLQQVLCLLIEPKKETLLEMLLMVDGMEEGIRAINALEHPASASLINGFRMVSNRAKDLLKKWNVSPIPGKGEKFNPLYHKAVGIQYTQEEENIIVEEQRYGYLLGNEVLRYAEVIVTKKENTWKPSLELI